jgi:hypothetical protein
LLLLAAGVDSLRGTLPWIAPEVIQNPESVTEAVSTQAGLVVVCSCHRNRDDGLPGHCNRKAVAAVNSMRTGWVD